MFARPVFMSAVVVAAVLQAGLPAAARPRRPHGALTHPVTRTCKPVRAYERTLAGSGTTVPVTDGEVFAVPAKGASGPLAVLVRLHSTGKGLSLRPNTTIDGQPATLAPVTVRHGGATWLLPDGEEADLWTVDLTQSEVFGLAQTISAGQGTAPAGLVSVGVAKRRTSATVATSECKGLALSVAAINGPIANRYAAAISSPSGLRWDEGHTTVAVFGIQGTTPTTPSEVHQATTRTWNALLHRAQVDERSARNRP